MKITKKQLRDLIREEIGSMPEEELNELFGLGKNWGDVEKGLDAADAGLDPEKAGRAEREGEEVAAVQQADAAQTLKSDVAKIKGLIGNIDSKPEIAQLLGVVLSLDFPPAVWRASAATAVDLALRTAASEGNPDGIPSVPEESINAAAKNITSRLRGSLTMLSKGVSQMRSAAQEAQAGERSRSERDVTVPAKGVDRSKTSTPAGVNVGSAGLTPGGTFEESVNREELIEAVLANFLS
tara:strand:- start:921 stop:1637 length:717 start_codon:yes stop_codon:yes gene_type:complete